MSTIKAWNDPEVIKFMRAVTAGGSDATCKENTDKKKFNSKRKQGEDLTVDGYINKHGGIYSNADDKVHTTKYSYMESIKNKGLTIKDW